MESSRGRWEGGRGGREGGGERGGGGRAGPRFTIGDFAMSTGGGGVGEWGGDSGQERQTHDIVQRFGSGQAVRRIEDEGLLKGLGQYTDDVAAGRAAAGVRALAVSACAHRVDRRGGGAMPGVLAVATGADLVAAGVKPIPGSPRFKRRAAWRAPRRRAGCSRTSGCASSARPWPSSWPRRCSRRAMQPKRCGSSTRSCRT